MAHRATTHAPYRGDEVSLFTLMNEAVVRFDEEGEDIKVFAYGRRARVRAGRVEWSTTQTTDSIVSACHFEHGWGFLTSRGVLYRADDFLGPLTEIGKLNWSSERFVGLSIPVSTFGMLEGDDDGRLRFSFGGAFEPVPNQVDGTVVAMSCADSKHCMISRMDGVVLRTSDAGQNWTVVPDVREAVNWITFRDGHFTLSAVSARPPLQYTVDGQAVTTTVTRDREIAPLPQEAIDAVTASKDQLIPWAIERREHGVVVALSDGTALMQTDAEPWEWIEKSGAVKTVLQEFQTPRCRLFSWRETAGAVCANGTPRASVYRWERDHFQLLPTPVPLARPFANRIAASAVPMVSDLDGSLVWLNRCRLSETSRDCVLAAPEFRLLTPLQSFEREAYFIARGTYQLNLDDDGVTVQMRSLLTGERVTATIEPHAANLWGNTAIGQRTSDGGLLVAVGRDGSMRMWIGRPGTTLVGHDLPSMGTRGLETLHFFDSSHGVLFDEDRGLVWFTLDAGATWSQIVLPRVMDLRAPYDDATEQHRFINCRFGVCSVGDRVAFRPSAMSSQGSAFATRNNGTEHEDEDETQTPSSNPFAYSVRAVSERKIPLPNTFPPPTSWRSIQSGDYSVSAGTSLRVERNPSRANDELVWEGSTEKGTYSAKANFPRRPEEQPPAVLCGSSLGLIFTQCDRYEPCRLSFVMPGGTPTQLPESTAVAFRRCEVLPDDRLVVLARERPVGANSQTQAWIADAQGVNRVGRTFPLDPIVPTLVGLREGQPEIVVLATRDRSQGYEIPLTAPGVRVLPPLDWTSAGVCNARTAQPFSGLRLYNATRAIESHDDIESASYGVDLNVDGAHTCIDALRASTAVGDRMVDRLYARATGGTIVGDRLRAGSVVVQRGGDVSFYFRAEHERVTWSLAGARPQ